MFALRSIYCSTCGLDSQKSEPRLLLYIDICYNYIRDLIEDEQVKPYHINGKKNPADILTKKPWSSLIQSFPSISWLRDTLSLSASTSIT